MSTLRRTLLTVFTLLAGFTAGLLADSFLLSRTLLSEWAKTINTDYANLLSFSASLLLVIVTIIYAGYTYRQVTYSRKQFLLDKQPYVIPAVLSRKFSDFEESQTAYTRTLRIEYKIENVGNEPAFSIQPFVFISYPDADGNLHPLKNSGVIPHAFAYLTPGKEQTGTITLYEKGVSEENEGLERIYPAFGYRLEENGDIIPDLGRGVPKRFPLLTVKIYYRNLVGQWFESVIREDITAVSRTAQEMEESYPRAVVRYRLEASQSIQHLPLEIREIGEDEVKKAFRVHGKDADYLKTADE